MPPALPSFAVLAIFEVLCKRLTDSYAIYPICNSMMVHRRLRSKWHRYTLIAAR